MKIGIAVAAVGVLSLFSHIGLAKEHQKPFPVTYEGGNLPLKQHKVKATIENDELVFAEGRHRVAVPVKQIAEIAVGTSAQRRFGVVGVVPVVHLGATETHYVALSCTGPVKSEALLRLSGSQYKEFVAALEKLTGMKAVDTNRVPTVVHYSL